MHKTVRNPNFKIGNFRIRNLYLQEIRIACECQCSTWGSAGGLSTLNNSPYISAYPYIF